jgi:DNA ligase-1
MITRPLLASSINDLSELKFPLLATPKLDGIRVLKIDGKVLTRKFKELPNHHIRNLLEKYLPDNIDGELITHGTFNEIQSKVMSFDGEPEFTFYAFDYVQGKLTDPYDIRTKDMKCVISKIKNSPFKIITLMPQLISNLDELMSYEQVCIDDGYEGVMLRNPKGKYKCGRSTPKEQILIKIKRFLDAEAKVIGFEEKLHNENIQETDEFGLAKRSSKKEGLIPANMLGSLIVEDLKTGVKFGLGSGFDDSLKREIWKNQKKYLNKIVKYKYQSVGVKDAPRFPVFLGFRSELDL